jgi:hypothetical protein
MDKTQLAQLLGFGGEDIAKALTTSSGFAGINLEAQAKLMLPLYAGLRNRIPVDAAKAGATQALYRAMLGYGTFDFGAAMGTAEAGVGVEIDGSAVEFACDYKSQAIKGDVTLQAIYAAKGYDDALAVQTSVNLSTLLKLEELGVLGGNEVALVDGSDGTGAAVGTGSYTATAVYVVTALTLQGTLANATASPVKGATITNAKLGESVGQTITCSGAGASKLAVNLSWKPVPGALGYKIYAGAAAASAVPVPVNTAIAYPTSSTTVVGTHMSVPTGQTFITTTACQVYADGTGTAMGATWLDGTANSNSYEGLTAWTQKGAATAPMYGKTLGAHPQVDCQGTILTPTGSGIEEFDTILAELWSTWKISPSLILCSPNGTAALSNALMGINSGFSNRIDITAERGRFVGGAYVGGYVNKYASTMLPGQPSSIEVWAHPEFPDGTFLFLTERIPYAYSREARAFALDVRIPYTYFELAKSSLSYPFSIVFDQTLKCYHPLAQASVVGVRVA